MLKIRNIFARIADILYRISPDHPAHIIHPGSDILNTFENKEYISHISYVTFYSYNYIVCELGTDKEYKLDEIKWPTEVIIISDSTWPEIPNLSSSVKPYDL
jgi:ribonucleotide reductase alpha subunit